MTVAQARPYLTPTERRLIDGLEDREREFNADLSHGIYGYVRRNILRQAARRAEAQQWTA